MNEKDIRMLTFVVGLAVAITAAFIQLQYISLVLFVVGLVVGFLNISHDEELKFLVAVLALGLGASSIQALSSTLSGVATVLSEVAWNVVLFAAAAALVVSIKVIVAIGKD